MDGRSARWQAHNEERRQRLIDAAVALIEEGADDLSLQAIGQRAGLARSVVYRQFSDRRDLDLAVQTHVLAGLRAELVPTLTLDGSVREIARRAIGVYVGWAAAHPRLHRVADYDTDVEGNGPLQRVIDEIAGRIAELLTVVLAGAGGTLAPVQSATEEALVHGAVGLVFGTVRHWVHGVDEGPAPTAEQLTQALAETVTGALVGRAAVYGVALDPDAPLSSLIGDPSTDGADPGGSGDPTVTRRGNG